MSTLASPAYRMVEFASEGAMLRGRFYVHAGHPKPAVVMAHGFSATISGMVADLYAEMIHAAGVQVLLFDHRGFGLSGGDSRHEINRWVQARGYRNALDFLTEQPSVDPERIAIWGDSLSGAVAIGVAAFDPRVRALIVQVPACGARRAVADPNGEGFEALRTIFDATDLARLPATTVGPAPVVSPDQLRTPSLLEIEGGHFGLLYPGTETFDRVADAQCRFIARHLVSQPPSEAAGRRPVRSECD